VLQRKKHQLLKKTVLQRKKLQLLKKKLLLKKIKKLKNHMKSLQAKLKNPKKMLLKKKHLLLKKMQKKKLLHLELKNPLELNLVLNLEKTENQRKMPSQKLLNFVKLFKLELSRKQRKFVLLLPSIFQLRLDLIVILNILVNLFQLVLNSINSQSLKPHLLLNLQ